MPLVTGAPIAIDAANNYPRQFGAAINPFVFQVGTKLYQVLASGNPIRVELSTDGGNTWSEQDAAHHPSTTSFQNSCFFDSVGGIIYVLYVASTGYVVFGFNTTTNLWGVASTQSVSGPGESKQQAALYRQSTGVLVVVVNNGVSPGTLSYATLTGYTSGAGGGTWSAFAALGVHPNTTVFGVLVDSSDNGIVVFADNSFNLFCGIISPAFALGTTVSLDPGFFDYVSTDQRLWNNKIAIAQSGSPGSSDNFLVVSIGSPISAPVFTLYSIYNVPSTGSLNHVTLAQDRNGKLVVFAAWTDYTTVPITNRLLMWTFDGVSSWGSPVVFYDEVANPPASSIAQNLQFIHTGGAVQLANGSWFYSTALEIMPAAVQLCAGFALISPPITAPAPTLACPLINTGTVGLPFDAQLIVGGGTPPFTFTIL